MKFTFQEIAAAGTGYIIPVSKDDNGVGGIYKVLNFMTGDDLFTHQLGRAGEACKEYIFSQHHWVRVLKDEIDLGRRGFSEDEKEEYHVWFSETIEKYKSKYGNEFEMVAVSDWERKDPIQELVEMVRSENIIVAAI